MKPRNKAEKKWKHRLERQRIQKYLRLQRVRVPAPKEDTENSTVQRIEHVTHKVPARFSIVHNPIETLKFLNEIEAIVDSHRTVYIDIENVEVMTIDAIVYFLSIMKNFRHQNKYFSIRGNFPKNPVIDQLLKDSGFYNFVKHKLSNFEKNENCVSIKESNIVDNETARDLTNFVREKMGVTKLKTQKFFESLIELMNNTIQHAYRDKAHYNNWYCYLQFLPDLRQIQVIFLDNGVGIPTTVQKNMFEQIQTWMTKKGLLAIGNVDLIEAALNGEFKTQTNLAYRGKGLPSISELAKKKHFRNFRVISNAGHYSTSEKSDMTTSLNGTLFYWEMDQRSFR